MNKWQGVGRVTKDLVLQKTGNGNSVVNFTLAIRRDNENTDYVFCSAFGKRAEHLSMYVKKGNRIGISGRLQTWSKEMNGRWEYGYAILCDEIEFLESKQQNQQQSNPVVNNYNNNYTPNETYTNINIDNEDLPF